MENIKGGEEFVKEMLKLKPDELCALSKFLGVRLLTDNVDPETKKAIPREGNEIIEDCIDHFAQLGRRDRRWLVKTLRQENQKNGR